MKKGLCALVLGALTLLQCRVAQVEMKPETVGAFTSLVLLRQEHYLERTPLNVVWGIQSFLDRLLKNVSLDSSLYAFQRSNPY